MPISRFSKVYAVCPANLKTGGPELLHQLVYQINQLGGDAMIAYVGNSDLCDRDDLCHPDFRKYVGPGECCLLEEIEDKEENAIVIPEGWAPQVLKIEKAFTFLWWLSVDNFKLKLNPEQQVEWLDFLKKRIDIHLTQSFYARNYLLSNGYPESSLRWLSDYVNMTYIDRIPLLEQVIKEDIVAFNPKKGEEQTRRLMECDPGLHWVPIMNMSTTEVCDLLQRSKIYIDFGNHPGKDRIPREAAISGCIVITNKRGAAAYKEDVNIPEEYKFEDGVSPNEITEFIRKCLKEYDQRIGDLEGYRTAILGEKSLFAEDVERIFM